MSEHDHADSKLDMPIFFGVLCTTALIITIGLMHWGALGITLMVLLACGEAVVMAYNFMHLKHKRSTLNVLLILTIIAFVSLLFWPAWDMAYSPRQNSDYITK